MAEEQFGSNLEFAFVGGSRALGNSKSTSDVDVFVVLSNSDREAESAYAKVLRTLHQQHNLHFDHCGELFSRDTLGNLLDFTESYISAVPEIGASACYQGGCLLSIFRKGHVVFNFLAGPKLHVRDITGTLSTLTSRSRDYLARWSFEFPQQLAEVILPRGSRQEHLRKLWRWNDSDEWINTPIGVGLERWFGYELTHRHQRLQLSVPTRSSSSSQSCPLKSLDDIYAVQCLVLSDSRR